MTSTPAAVKKARKPRKDKGVKRGPRKKASPANGKATPRPSKTSAAPKAGGVCLCCGKATRGRKSRFLPGHDAKIKAPLMAVAAGEAKLNSLPDPVRAALAAGPVAGFRLDGSTVRKA